MTKMGKMDENLAKSFILIASIFFSSIIIHSIYESGINFDGNLNFKEKDEEKLPNIPLTTKQEIQLTLLKNLLDNPPQFKKNEIDKWSEIVLEVDQNYDGINDNLEEKIKLFPEYWREDGESAVGRNTLNIFDSMTITDNKDSEKIENNRIPIIISFPNGEITSIYSLFSDMGGKISSKYNAAINGFAGDIEYSNLQEFCEVLKLASVPFLVEEDVVNEASLYYASRNMNLRPYVWNNLSYTGDKYGSIAVLDTGIDDSHNFFAPGYENGNNNYKIVGWKDEINNISLPYDDHGHGSHCSGIATGVGSPAYDEDGRLVYSYSIGLGYYVVSNPGSLDFTMPSFRVTDPGVVEVYCEFNYSSGSIDSVNAKAYLYREETVVDSFESPELNWSHILKENVTSSKCGDYSLKLILEFIDNDDDDLVYLEPIMEFNSVFRWPFNPPSLNCGDPWKGVAPDAQLVGVKVLSASGSGSSSGIIDGINWVIENKDIYNITTISMSLGGSPGQVSMINAVNNAVENGIVTVVAAGNSGGFGGSNNIGSPGDADNVITVAAMSINDQVTSYSSSGGYSFTRATMKPDIMAPGGSSYNYSIFSADSNDNDNFAQWGYYTSDRYSDDLAAGSGTSMATPAVAGAVNLLIEAMGGYQNWNFTAVEAKRVKALLLMTATETYPLNREYNEEFSPLLNRGEKDVHEGYGRINIDAAIESYTKELTQFSSETALLTSSDINALNKHALGCHVNLVGGENYKFILSVPEGADFDLHIYSNLPSSTGEPIMLSSSISPVLGEDEIICFSPLESGKYYLVAKAISGQGIANISYHANNLEPSLTDGDILPSMGTQVDLFNFTVKYTDPDDIKPNYVYLSANGTYYPMVKLNPNDNNYADGIIYQFLGYFQPGRYNMTFICKDGRFIKSLIQDSIFLVTERINENTPFLANGRVNPELGYNSTTLFTFKVDYYDADNNEPQFVNISVNSTQASMVKQDPLDTNYMDGCIYVFSMNLANVGEYIYNFTCSDGTSSYSLGPCFGPNVEQIGKIPFNGMYVSHTYSLIGLPYHYNSNFSYSYDSGNIYDVYWDLYAIGWTENSLSRKITTSGYSLIRNQSHSPIWIFTNISLGDQVLISTLNSGDHIFNVVGETTYNFAGADPVDIWVLEDMMFPEAVVWYEKSTGILLNGTFYADSWFFYTFKFIDTNVPFSIIPNEYEPSLTGEMVIPGGGDQTTLFNFSVIYTDKDNYHPTYINVKINGTAFPMEKQNSLDDNYADGCLYQYLGYIQPGTYSYSFECADWKYSNSTIEYYGLIVDNKTNINKPILIDGRVTPERGYKNITSFSFKVDYYDADNNEPEYVNVAINSIIYSMVKQNPLDTNYMDGCVYILCIKLYEEGVYLYDFACSDGSFTDMAGPFYGPLVEEMGNIPFHGMNVNHIFSVPLADISYVSNLSYSQVSESLFEVNWDISGNMNTWVIDSHNRIMENATGMFNFGNQFHTPMWIFTDITIGDNILIAVDGEGDHEFTVSKEIVCDYSGIGPIEVWELIDLTTPGGIAWYEKSTGILLNGTFFYMRGLIWYDFDFVSTNAEIELNIDLIPIADFMINATTIKSGDFVLFTFNGSEGNLPAIYFWNFGDGFNSTEKNPIHQYTTPGVYNITLTITDSDGDMDTIVYTITVLPEIKIPGYDLIFILGAISAASVILYIRRRKRLNFQL